MDKSEPRGISKIFSRFKTKMDEDTVEEEIKSIVTEGQEQGIILNDEAEMISNIFEFGDKQAKDIMTSRQKIVGIEENDDLETAINFMLDQNYSRYPLYEEDIDNIIGIIHLKDAMKEYMQKSSHQLKEIAREAFFVHPTQSISKLFKKMQSDKIHMAIVVDEYGQTEGIIAMEDILEVIVGNILDEYDTEEIDIVKLGKEESYLVRGMTRLDELEDILEIEFPDEDIDTLNGFMLFQLGRLPVEHEETEIVYQGFSFKPIDVHDNMIVQVKVSKVSIEEDNI